MALPLRPPTSIHCKLKEKITNHKSRTFYSKKRSQEILWKQGPTLQKKDRILIWDLISYKLKYRTKEARLILQSGIYNYFLLPISEGAALNKEGCAFRNIGNEKIYIPDCKISLASHLRKNLSMTTYPLMTSPVQCFNQWLKHAWQLVSRQRTFSVFS